MKELRVVSLFASFMIVLCMKNRARLETTSWHEHKEHLAATSDVTDTTVGHAAMKRVVHV